MWFGDLVLRESLDLLRSYPSHFIASRCDCYMYSFAVQFIPPTLLSHLIGTLEPSDSGSLLMVTSIHWKQRKKSLSKRKKDPAVVLPANEIPSLPREEDTDLI